MAYYLLKRKLDYNQLIIGLQTIHQMNQRLPLAAGLTRESSDEVFFQFLMKCSSNELFNLREWHLRRLWAVLHLIPQEAGKRQRSRARAEGALIYLQSQLDIKKQIFGENYTGYVMGFKSSSSEPTEEKMMIQQKENRKSHPSSVVSLYLQAQIQKSLSVSHLINKISQRIFVLLKKMNRHSFSTINKNEIHLIKISHKMILYTLALSLSIIPCLALLAIILLVILVIIIMQSIDLDSEGNYFEVLKPSERQLQSHHLLHTVRQVNGDYALKQIQERSSVLRFSRRGALPPAYLSGFFGYVSTGEVFVYKEAKNKFYEEKYHSQITHSINFREKVFVTSHRAHEIFGFQEYPLNWAERIMVEAAEGTRLIIFPVELALTSFKKIFNLTVIQLRAELLKRCEFFHGQEIEKLKRIALYSKRCQGSKGQILVKEGDVLTHLIVIVSGQAYCIRGIGRQVVGRDKEVGLEDLMTENSRSQFFLSCLTDCQFVLVPKAQAVRFYKIKYRLEDKQSVQFKSRRATQYQNIDKTPRKDKHETSPSDRKPFFTRVHKDRGKISSVKMRPNTSINRSDGKKQGEIRFSTFYDQQKTTPHKPARNFKTEASDCQDFLFSRVQGEEETGMAVGISGQNISLGELCLRKFLTRKEKRENGEIMKYLRSNAPELKLNPSKDYAVVKPLHVGDSSYVKNFKRKLKKTYVKSGGQKMRQEKRSQARFSFFFKEDSIE